MAEEKDFKLIRGDDPLSVASLTQTKGGHELHVGREGEDAESEEGSTED